MLGTPRRCCDGLTRRETLRAGGLALMGSLDLPKLFAAQENAPQRLLTAKAKNVIVLYLLGGAPTQDMYDLKPHAPADVRGEFNPIHSAVPGIDVCELLPGVARWMHRAAIVRSVNHKAGCHNTLPSYSGYELPLDNIVSTKESYPPSMGSVVSYLDERAGMPSGEIPSYVYMPCYLGWGQSIVRPGPYGGFLGRRYDPLFTECNPYVDNPPDVPYHSQPLRGEPRLPHSTLPDDITVDRLSARRDLVSQIDDHLRQLEGHGGVSLYDRHRQRAFDVLTSPRLKSVFDLETEEPRLRDRYGRTLFGQSALIGRRLIEEGARFVNVTWDCYAERLKLQYECWDLHERNCAILRDYNLPYFDQTYSALMEDLDSRGLLDETLVAVLSDMGRTPKINARGGRDHWTFCYSVLLAGAGIRGGTVYGASDSQAAFVKDHPVSTADVCATIYEALGIDPETLVPDIVGRPLPIAHGGRPIHEVLA